MEPNDFECAILHKAAHKLQRMFDLFRWTWNKPVTHVPTEIEIYELLRRFFSDLKKYATHSTMTLQYTSSGRVMIFASVNEENILVDIKVFLEIATVPIENQEHLNDEQKQHYISER
jgi:hypothetical protein